MKPEEIAESGWRHAVTGASPLKDFDEVRRALLRGHTTPVVVDAETYRRLQAKAAAEGTTVEAAWADVAGRGLAAWLLGEDVP